MFRFVDRSFGLVLPRRHYVPSSEYTDVPMNNIIRSPSFIDIPSSLTPTVTPAANPGQEASTSTGILARLAALQDQGRSRPDSPVSVFSDDDLSRPGSPDNHSLSVPAGGSSTSIKQGLSQPQHRSAISPPSRSGAASPYLQQFGPSPKSSLSVPLTHPVSQGGAELPSDKVANAIAGNLSEDERKRQLAQEQGLVTHYDIDGECMKQLGKSSMDTRENDQLTNLHCLSPIHFAVLTKVLVYTNIGFFAASIIPAFFEYVGLSDP